MPGSAGLRASDSGQSKRENTRHCSHTVWGWLCLSSVPASHQKGQCRHRLRLQRWPSVAYRCCRCLHQGDRRLLYSWRVNTIWQRSFKGNWLYGASAPLLQLYNQSSRTSWSATDWTCWLERLSELKLLLRGARRVLPDLWTIWRT